jgi:hypothetical protein
MVFQLQSYQVSLAFPILSGVLEQDIPERRENVVYVMELENVLLVEVQGYIDV